MAKKLVLTRDSAGEWYKRAQEFISSNTSKPLQMMIGDDDAANHEFRSALASLQTLSGEPVELDSKAALVVVVAGANDLDRSLSRCLCMCGTDYSCGGSGSGH